MNDGKRAARTSETELLGAEEVAGLVGVKETTVYKWCKEGKLPCLKVGKHWRVRRGDLEGFLKRSQHQVTLADEGGGRSPRRQTGGRARPAPRGRGREGPHGVGLLQLGEAGRPADGLRAAEEVDGTRGHSAVGGQDGGA